MSIEAMKHYEAALKEAFPMGAAGNVFHHWNEARKAIEQAEPVVCKPVAWLGYHFKTGLPDFAYDMPTPSVMRDFNMRPLVYGDTPPPPRHPLTTEQIMANAVLRYHFALNGGEGPISKQGRKIIDAIEAAHGIKGKE